MPYPDFQLRLPHLLANNRKIEWVPSLAESYCIPSERRCSNDCNVHLAHFLSHKRERVARSFYFLRRCALAQSRPSMQPKCQHDLGCIGITELYILWDMLHWICGSLDWEQQEEAGVWYEAPDFVLGISTTTMPDWEHSRDMVVDAYCSERHLGADELRLSVP